MTKAAIPSVQTGKPDLDKVLSAIKQNMDQITGQARNVRKLAPLPATASLADVIAQVNAITERLQ
jgi:hypothetical protein